MQNGFILPLEKFKNFQQRWNYVMNCFLLVMEPEDFQILADFFQENEVLNEKACNYLRNSLGEVKIQDFIIASEEIFVSNQTLKTSPLWKVKEIEARYKFNQYKESELIYKIGKKIFHIYFSLGKGNMKNLLFYVKQINQWGAESWESNLHSEGMKISNPDDFIDKIPYCFYLNKEEVFNYYIIKTLKEKYLLNNKVPTIEHK